MPGLVAANPLQASIFRFIVKQGRVYLSGWICPLPPDAPVEPHFCCQLLFVTQFRPNPACIGDQT